MNPNSLLLWLVYFSCISLVARSLRLPSRQVGSWRLSAAIVLVATTVARLLAPAVAGFIGAAVWFLLLVLPVFILARADRLFARAQYQRALDLTERWFRVYPLPVWRDRMESFRALAAASRGDFEAARQHLAPQRDRTDAGGRFATLLTFRVESRWDEMRSWLDANVEPADARKEIDLLLYDLRAFGETGQIDRLLQAWQQRSPNLERRGNSRNLLVAWLFVLAFCGQTEGVRELLQKFPNVCVDRTRAFWQIAARQHAGENVRAQFLDLRDRADAMQQTEIDWRLHHVPAVFVPTPQQQTILDRICIEIGQEARYRFGLRAARQGRDRPYVTYTAIVLNLIAFALEIGLGGSQNPATLVRLGALVPELVFQNGEWWRAIAANFLHYGWAHLAVNLLGLYTLGMFLEPRLGKIRYLFCYATSGIGTMLCLLAAGHMAVGASGAIMGLVGAATAFFWQGWRYERARIAKRNARMLLAIVVMQMVFDIIVPQASFLGHISGFLVGFAVYLVLPKRSLKTMA